MTAHNNIPCIIGLIPTERSTSSDREAPMKNIVIVRHLRARIEMTFPNSGTLSRMNVFNRIAMIKYRINHGIVIFRSLLLKMNEVVSASGMIHNARVNLIVVATLRASSP